MKGIRPFIVLARPSHYLKNGFVLVPLFFAHQLTDLSSVAAALLGFVGFCLMASAVYVLNDIVDRVKDADHPFKRRRPVAAGDIPRSQALIFGLFLSALAGGVCLLIGRLDYGLILLLYVVVNVFYSIRLQNVAVLNTGCVAAGFVLRVFAGAAVIDVPVSGWLAALTFLLAFFLAFSKRRCEHPADGKTDKTPQRVRPGTGGFILAGACLTGYAVYTLSPSVIREHSSPYLYLTTVWVGLGLFRYLKVGYNRAGDCSPVSVFLNDRPLQIFVLMWVVTLWWVIYINGG